MGSAAGSPSAAKNPRGAAPDWEEGALSGGALGPWARQISEKA